MRKKSYVWDTKVDGADDGKERVKALTGAKGSALKIYNNYANRRLIQKAKVSFRRIVLWNNIQPSSTSTHLPPHTSRTLSWRAM